MSSKKHTVSFTVEQTYEIEVETKLNFEELFSYYYEGYMEGKIDLVDKIKSGIAVPVGEPEVISDSIETGEKDG
jgi:tRNA(Ser,Leu) C12 N-acetylase TAN1